MALPEPRPMTELTLAPAQRADLIVDISGPVGFDMLTRQGPYRLVDLAVSGTNADRQAEPSRALSSPNLPTPAAPEPASDADDDGRRNGWATRR